MKLNPFIALSFAVSLVSASPCVPDPRKFSRLVVFGDSYSDNGNGSWVASNHKWPVDPAYYHHSFSNGPKWNEVAAEALHLQLVNLATGGATADNDLVAGGTGADSTIKVPSTKDQINNFLATDKPRPGDIFVQWIGANDILFDPTITGKKVSDVIAKQIDKLYKAGAKTVLVANYIDFNAFPATFSSADYSTENVKSYNQDLTEALKKVVNGFSNQLRTGLVDITGLYHKIVANPSKYNFDAKYLNPPTACLTGVYTAEKVPRHLCDDPGRHFFFDSYHPTKRAHALFGDLFVKTIKAF